jgi:hypothetical protein
LIGAAARGAFVLGVAGFIGSAALTVPSRLADPRREIRPAEPELGACLATGCPDAVRERQVALLEDFLFARMPGLDPALHEDLARAILSESEAARLDPLLALAVIEVESGYDPSAVSAAGALGLMQLLPGTMKREVAGLGPEHRDPQDPISNVRAGVRYLRRCLDSYPDPEVALMAYNAGPNRLYGWIRAGTIPPEVVAYARRVLAEHLRLQQALPAEVGPRFAETSLPGR